MSEQVLRNERTFNGSRREAAADGALNAGDVVEQTANGIQSHSSDGAVLDKVLIAEDDAGRGKEAGDSYADTETVPYLNCNAGDLVTLRLADGESTTGPDGGSPTKLVSNGDGTVRAFNADSAGSEIAEADETVTASGVTLINAVVLR